MAGEAWQKRLIELSLTFAVDAEPTWTEAEINRVGLDSRTAIDYWNHQPIPFVFNIVAYRSMACIGWELMDYYQLFAQADTALPSGTLLLLKRRRMMYGGFARFGKYALVADDGLLAARMAHELGHYIGATDHREWGEYGWECDPEPDIMCGGIFSQALSWRTLYEIARAEGV